VSRWLVLVFLYLYLIVLAYDKKIGEVGQKVTGVHKLERRSCRGDIGLLRLD
jgi:hypothetical protein